MGPVLTENLMGPHPESETLTISPRFRRLSAIIVKAVNTRRRAIKVEVAYRMLDSSDYQPLVNPLSELKRLARAKAAK